MRNFREIVAGRLKEFGLSTAAVERSGGLPPDAIRNVLRGRSPRYDQVLKICDTLDLELVIRPRPEPGPEQDTGGPKGRAKAAVLAVYLTAAPWQDIVDQLRRMPENIVAAVIDDMVAAEEHEDAEELRSMARQAGHTVW